MTLAVEIVLVDLSSTAQARAVDELLDEFIGEGFWADEAGAAPSNQAAQLAKLDYVRCWLAYVDGRPVGLAVCFELYATFRASRFINIHDLVVTASMRRRGIGSALLAAIEKEARLSGACKVTLEVEEGNGSALGLYHARGYSERRYGEEAGRSLYMSKKLD